MISEPPQVVAEGSSLLAEAYPILKCMFVVLMSVFERLFGDPKIYDFLSCYEFAKGLQK